MSTEEVMDAVMLSRGNVNINLRELVNWNLVTKQNKIGERKEYFIANHDIWSMAQSIANERKRRELQPVLSFLRAMKNEKIEGSKSEVAHFRTLITDLEDFVAQLDHLSDLLLKIQDNAFYKRMVKMLT